MRVTPSLFVLLLFVAACAAAPRAERAMVARGGENSVTLHGAPCEGNALLQTYRRGSMIYKGQRFEVCWRARGESVTVIDAAGDVTRVPVEAFSIEITEEK